jgi:hypothetical protein
MSKTSKNQSTHYEKRFKGEGGEGLLSVDELNSPKGYGQNNSLTAFLGYISLK